MSVRSTLALAGTLLLGLNHTTIAAPAEAAESWSSMTAAKFKSLPDSASIRMGTRVLTKGDILNMFRQASARSLQSFSGASVPAANLAVLDAKIQQEEQATVMSQNARVQAAYQSASVVPLQEKKLLGLVLPAVSAVEGTAQHKAVIYIKGKDFGNAQGSVTLSGNFPGGSLKLKVLSWGDKNILAEVLFPEGGAQDQNNAIITVTTPAGQSSAAHGGVKFVAERSYREYDWQFASINCSQSGASNECGYWPAPNDKRGVMGVHMAFPDGSTYYGQDSVALNLMNGWKRASHGGAFEGCVGPGSKSKGHGSMLDYSDGVNIKWNLQTTFQSAVDIDTIQRDYCIVGIVRGLLINGPRGVPYH